MTLTRFKPAVPKCWLFVVSGVMWSVVGLMMCVTGVGWLIREGIVRGAGFEIVGLVLAITAVRLGFNRIALKNISRLGRLPERGCFFAFQAWKGYLIIAVMIALGITLRHSAIPKAYLAVVYTAIGGGLLLSSCRYYQHVARLRQIEPRRQLRP